MKIKFYALPAIFIFCFFCLACTTARAESEARKALEHSVNAILAVIKNPAYSSPATRAPLREKVEGEVGRIFDFGEFSSRTVGMNWRSFSPEQKKNFINAFSDLLKATYLDRIDGYNGEQIKYLNEVSDDSGNRVEVRTALILKNGKSLPVSYRMMPKDKTWVVYDVLIEGVSLVKNYRTQFQDILDKGTPEQLIERVRAKAAEIENSAGRSKD